jgi:hypothetical protein
VTTARTRPRTARTRPSPVPGPQLGATTFEEWFDTPVFEVGVDPDERLEQLATSKRRTARLLGSAALRWRGRRPAGRADLPLDLRVEGEDRRAEAAAPAPPGAGAGAGGQGRPRRPAQPEPIPTPPPEGSVAPPVLAVEATPLPPAGRRRRRIDDLLDRWAEKEAAGQQKLERLVLPSRWRSWS